MSPNHLYGEYRGGGGRHQLCSLLGAFAKQLQRVVTSLIMSVRPYDCHSVHMDICDLQQSNVREISYIYIYETCTKNILVIKIQDKIRQK